MSPNEVADILMAVVIAPILLAFICLVIRDEWKEHKARRDPYGRLDKEKP